MAKTCHLPKSFILFFVSTAITACSNGDPNYRLNDITTWHSPAIKTYDDYMMSANEKVKIGDSKGVIAMYSKAVEKAKAEYGPNDLRVANSASYLASYCASLGLMGEAETYYKKALAVDITALGPDNAETIRVRNALADVLVKLFKVDEAKKLLYKSKSNFDKESKKH